MRNANRIPEICAAIAEIWAEHPDLRFMQMISNFQGSKGNDCYYMEDADFIEQFRKNAEEVYR